MSDPIWIADVLRAEGLVVHEIAGWRDRGHGDFGDIWGVVCHHTGSNNASAESIAFHPDLGLASQLHLNRAGEYTVCGVGVAWHAGQGSWPGLPVNNANYHTIGIEAANDGGGSPGRPHRSSWPDVQYNAYVRGVAAIIRKLGKGADHVLGHKDWAGPAQGKWDPGAIDMNIFRRDVGAVLNRNVPDPILINAIGEQYARSPWLGAKLTAEVELPTPDGRGRFAAYEHGHIYWTPETGAFPVPERLFEPWAALGFEHGPLGYPVAYHTVLRDGDVQAFERGVLYRKYGGDGFYITGLIGDRYRRSGYEQGPMGWPTSNEMPFPGGVYQQFENGSIAWSLDGTVALTPGSQVIA